MSRERNFQKKKLDDFSRFSRVTHTILWILRYVRPKFSQPDLNKFWKTNSGYRHRTVLKSRIITGIYPWFWIADTRTLITDLLKAWENKRLPVGYGTLFIDWCVTTYFLLPGSSWDIAVKPYLASTAQAVLRIRDILVRIRICGSVPLTNVSLSGFCCFFHWPSRHQQKTIFSRLFFLLLFEGTFTSFFKDKMS